ncbi:histidinol-phosphate transaminase [Lacticaseibacillus chiayiensis]|uniref:Histidinol-phosphate aminotransferase n=1 Tax=Lacticaseibacillus chiayiensis TaxID=2100821 RepID=A0A4Q1TW71_9LACO|nr:histidinol-phosphate transaminase [Lacticaseibacillus chiayiensis]QVI36031.1 aminotransferase class I/II-fold pyridoxal phosphate-dependent enzyme [Lacticaseibacillus chiayiensis]RXT22635.1 histidinol-phosphate transaminase [Lacticaseibacillus chiayiensis]UYN57736.1 aminotransferase class I/II-fold pyridoxal phosphate-dependent enzyme [Lacticaseibacillus chiayiensis]
MLRKSIAGLPDYVSDSTPERIAKAAGLAKMTRLSFNENPVGTSPKVQKAIADWAFSQARSYPDPDAMPLRTAVAERLHLPADQLLFSSGLDEMIALICRTFLDIGDESLQPWPAYPEYQLQAAIAGAVTVNAPVDEATGRIDLQALLAGITAKTKVIWLCNPNNPTGTYLSVTEIAEFMAQVPPEILVVVDEAYIDFVDQVINPSVLPLITAFANLLVMRTFSKLFGLANFRVGFSIVPKALIPKMQNVRLPYNISGLSQTAALAAWEDVAFTQKVKRQLFAARQQWTTFFDHHHIRHYATQTNFMLYQVAQPLALGAFLKQHGYLVRDSMVPGWIRQSFGTPKQDAEVQGLLLDFLKTASPLVK